MIMKKIFNILIITLIVTLLIGCQQKIEVVTPDDFYLGKYPQTLVVDEEIILSLKKITDKNEYGYYVYNGEEYHLYKDKYYKVEPIKWVKYETNNKTFYLAEKVLDAQVFMSDEYFKVDIYSYVTKEGVPENTHANNYYYSDLRKWLNTNFFATAFTSEEMKKIALTVNDNSPETTMESPNKYACETTEDYVFALSVSEMRGYKQEPVKPTDYAIACGAVPHNSLKIDSEYNGYIAYWLRSPNNYYSYNVSGVNYNGITYNYINCYYKEIGVRPTICLK